MIQVLKGKRDIGGNLANALYSGYKQAQQAHETEQSQIRGEERKMNMGREEESRQESRLREAIKAAYADPRFKNEDPAEKQRVLYEHIAPVNSQVANQIATADLNLIKAQQPGKGPAPSNAPVPPETSAKIAKVMDNSKGLSASQLAQKFDEAGVERVFANSYVETRRREDETNAKNELKQQNANRQEKLQFHKESEKYDEDLIKKTQVAKRQIEAIDDIEKRLKSGNVKPNSMAAMFKGMGKIGDKISSALKNADQAAIDASIPQLLEGWKDIFGVRLSDADLKILQDKLPSITTAPESNKAILKILRKYADMTLLRSKIANDIVKENEDLRPLGYARKIEERFDEMIKPVKVINPNNGKQIDIPAYQLQEALNKGAKLVNE